MHKFINNTESKNSMTTFERLGSAGTQPQPHQYWTVEKAYPNKRISEHGSKEEFYDQQSQQPLSNFSTQYREFKTKTLAKSQEKRNFGGNLP